MKLKIKKPQILQKKLEQFEFCITKMTLVIFYVYSIIL